MSLDQRIPPPTDMAALEEDLKRAREQDRLKEALDAQQVPGYESAQEYEESQRAGKAAEWWLNVPGDFLTGTIRGMLNSGDAVLDAAKGVARTGDMGAMMGMPAQRPSDPRGGIQAPEDNVVPDVKWDDILPGEFISSVEEWTQQRENESTDIGRMRQTLFQFAGPFMMFAKAFGGFQSGQTAMNVARGAFADAAASATALSEQEGRLAELLMEFDPTGLARNAALEYLVSREDEGPAEARLKNVLDSQLGAAAFGIPFGALKFFKLARKRLMAGEIGMKVPGAPNTQGGKLDVFGEKQDGEFEAIVDRYLTDEERRLMTDSDEVKIKEYLNDPNIAAPDEIVAMAAAGGAKRGWYEASARAISHVFGGGEDATRFTTLLSATSPQTSVESNLRNALNIWREWTAAGRPTDPEEIKRLMGLAVEAVDLDSLNPARKSDAQRLRTMRDSARKLGLDAPEEPAAVLEWLQSVDLATARQLSVLPAWINNSIRALTRDADTMLDTGISGPKVTSFARNLMGWSDEVTQDTWMARALGLSQKKDFDGRPLSGYEDEVGSMGQKKPGYMAGNILVRMAADKMSELTGDVWTAAEIQETVWSWAKTLYELGGAKGEKRSLPSILRDGGVTDDLVRDTPDFATLFRDNEEFRGILEASGYGERIESIPDTGFGSRGAIGSGIAEGGALESAARRLDRTGRKLGSGTGNDVRALVLEIGKRPPSGVVPGTVPGSFRRGTRRSGGGVLRDRPVTIYSLPKEQQKRFQDLGISTPAVNETADAEVFHAAIMEAKQRNRYGGAVHAYTPEEYANMRLFLTTDGTAGFALKPDGDIVSLFNRQDGPHSRVTAYMLALAREQGGNKLDAFDISDGLPRLYDLAGFKETSREPWNEAYRPEDWPDELGTPDVVYMELTDG